MDVKRLICKIFGCKIRKIELFRGSGYYVCLRCGAQTFKEPKRLIVEEEQCVKPVQK